MYAYTIAHNKVKRELTNSSTVLQTHKQTNELTMQHWCVWERYISYKNNKTNSTTGMVYGSETHLLVSITPARMESSLSCKTSTRVSQVTGCLPLPVSHSWRISVLIRSALSLYSWTMLSTLAPESSSSRIVPNVLYCVLISWGYWFSSPGQGSSAAHAGVGGLPAAWS